MFGQGGEGRREYLDRVERRGKNVCVVEEGEGRQAREWDLGVEWVREKLNEQGRLLCGERVFGQGGEGRRMFRQGEEGM